MDVALLIAVIVSMAMQNTSKKMYADRAGGGNVYFYGAISSLFSALCFAISSLGSLSFTAATLPYSIAFGLSFALCTYSMTVAVSIGPLSLTSLMISYSLMLPTLYGLIFFNESVSPFFYVGILLLVISLALINMKGKKEEDGKIGFKWLVTAGLAFLTNGVCTIIMNVQQKNFSGQYKNEFMIPALLLSAVIFSVMFAVKERRDATKLLRSGTFPAAFGGTMHFVTNLSVLFLVGLLPASLTYPLISAGGIILTYLISVLIYREKLSRLQFAGFIMGVVSVVFLSI